MRGTNIYYISGRQPIRKANPSGGWVMAGQGSGLFGEGPYYPTNPPLTADSAPNIDSLVPFNSYWSAQAYIDWFNMNVAAYGLATAQSKMNQAINQWSGIGAEATYCTDSNWTQFFVTNGVPSITSVFCKLANPVVTTASNVLNTAANLSTTAANTSSVLTWILPVAGVGLVAWAGFHYLGNAPKVSGPSHPMTGGEKLALAAGAVILLYELGKPGNATANPAVVVPNPAGTIPTITVTAINPTTHAVTFRMDVPNNPPFIDTCYPGDQVQTVTSNDGKYTFISDAQSDPTGVMLTINGSDGTALVSISIAYAYPQSGLPDVEKES